MKNSLANVRPDLAEQWDVHRNGSKNADTVSVGSNYSAWWVCPVTGNSWKASVKARVSTPSAMSPFMSNRKLAVGYNDLETKRPDLAGQWSPTNEKPPSEVIFNSKEPIEWVCGVTGYRWAESPRKRTSYRNSDSPAVRGEVVVDGYNDLSTHVPSVVDKWGASNTKQPCETYFNGTDKIYLVDDMTGVEWKTTPRFLSKRGNSKPSRSLTVGINDLATVHPELAAQLHPSVDPTTLTAKSNEKVKWVCPETGGVWEAVVSNRVRTGLRSPFQTRGLVVAGINDLASQRPDLFAQLVHPKQAVRVGIKSTQKLLWKCPVYGLEWEEPVYRRTRRATADSPYVRNVRVVPGVNDLMSKYPWVKNIWDYNLNEVDPETIFPKSHLMAYWKCAKGKHGSWSAIVSDVVRNDGRQSSCPLCVTVTRVSKGETEIVDFLERIGCKTESQVKFLLINKCFDIYLPEHSIAIEFNGLYWHSEKFSPKSKHRLLYENARINGLRVITVWEDDWSERQGIVKSMLRHAVGKSTDKCYARNTSIRKINADEAGDFLDKYHIQGRGSRSMTHYGAYHDSELVAVSSWVKRKNELEMTRYATAKPVVGGMGKMISKGKSLARDNGLSVISTFSDNSVSDGESYSKLGFAKSKVIEEDYKYVVGKRRVHKANYRKSRFREDPTLKYDPSMTEKELAELNGIPRIWDCGKVKWILAA